MSILNALEECLLYIRRCVPPFDEAALLASLQRPGSDPSLSGSILDDAPAATALRSRALQPLAQVLSGYPSFMDADLNAELAEFRTARQRLTAAAGDSGQHPDLIVAHEVRRAFAFMVVEPAASLSDGAAHVASDGYFAENNMPPWDTWATSVPSPPGTSSDWGPALLCWVPPWTRGRVEAGIVVNPEQCLHWVRLQDGAVDWE